MADYHRIMNSLARCQAAYDNMQPDDDEPIAEQYDDFWPDDDDRIDEDAAFGGMENGY
jgi:hypothetical protein